MIKIRITPAVAADLVEQEIRRKPFCNITDPGDYEFFPEEAAALLVYAETVDSRESGLSFGQKRAFVALAKQLRDQGVVPFGLLDPVPLVDMADELEAIYLSPEDETVEDADLDPETAAYFSAETRPEAKPGPVAIGTLPPGAKIRRGGTILEISLDQSGVMPGYVGVSGGQRGLAYPTYQKVLPA